jgi:lipocalin
MKKTTVILSILGMLGCKTSSALKTVPALDINKYAGTWYEIGRFPHSFEKSLNRVSATYEIKDNGKIKVLNVGYSKTDSTKKKEITGTAWVPNSQEPGKIKVQFFWPFAGDYWVIHLDEAYTEAVVGSPGLDYLWILSRNTEMAEADYQRLLQVAADAGFDTKRVERVKQK